MKRLELAKPVLAALACVAAVVATGALAEPGPGAPPAARSASQADRQPVRHARPRLDRTGRQRVGKASIYAPKFDGRKMADGTPMDPQDDNAASKTLPLGTTAKVTNLQTGRSAVVTIQDRGPHVAGRIVDLSPATAEKVGIDRRQGVSKVTVTPITLPPAADPDKAHGDAREAAPAPRHSTMPPAPH